MSFAQHARIRKPLGETYIPHPYQEEGIRWLLEHPRAGLFLSPGLGKTSIALAAFRILRHKEIVNKMLVIAPLRVCYMVWPREIQKWSNFTNISIGILHGPKKDKVLREEHDVYVINPEGLRWLSSQVGNKKLDLDQDQWILISDESSLFKNGRSQRFKTLKGLLKYFPRRVIMTGTPASNGLENLWSQMYLLDNGARLGQYITHYRNQFFYPAGYMGYEYRLQRGAEQEIYGLINDIVMHKNADELDLPERIDNYINVQLPQEARDIYESMKRSYIAEAGENLALAVNAAVASGKLREIANGGVYSIDKAVNHLHDEKTNVVLDLAEELGGRPLLVFYEFNHDLQRLQKAFPNAPHIGGGITAKKSDKIATQWNNGEIPILLIHPRSGGHGLNLQDGGCHDIAWYSIPWDLELYIQANARVHRQGVKNSVTIHHVVAEDTIDERVVRVLVSKGNVQTALLNAMMK